MPENKSTHCFYKSCKYVIFFGLSFRYFLLTETYIQILNKKNKLLANGFHGLIEKLFVSKVFSCLEQNDVLFVVSC